MIIRVQYVRAHIILFLLITVDRIVSLEIYRVRKVVSKKFKMSDFNSMIVPVFTDCSQSFLIDISSFCVDISRPNPL